MKFYDCSTAPSPRRVRMFIVEKGLEIETIQVDLRHGEHLKPPFMALNPKATVPVLELDDGTVLNDSTAICQYLDDVFPDHNLTGVDAKERALITMAQTDMEYNGFHAVAECYRNRSRGFKGRALAGPVSYAQIPELSERGRARVLEFFKNLDQRLSQQEFVAGDRFTVADITAFITVDFSRVIKEKPPESMVHLHGWLGSMAARESARA